MSSVAHVFRREFAGYFITPVAYVFIVLFLALAAALTFYVGAFFERGRADLLSFFQWHPWLYLFFMPAISMRLWAEERKTGTIELFLTLPVSTAAAVVGKFLAAWLFAGLALALTFPIWLTVNYLGEPDNGVVAASYIGSFLMAGAYLAIGSCLSALTRNQVIAFVLTVTVCFLFNVLGAGVVQPVFGDAIPAEFLETLASFSLLSHFNNIVKGVIDLRDLAYYALAIGVWLAAATITVDLKKAG